MAECPSCHKSLEILDKHLGTLFTCSHCNAVFFVNWDGTPEIATHEEPEEAPSFEPAADFNPMPGPMDYGDETRIAPPPTATAPVAPEPSNDFTPEENLDEPQYANDVPEANFEDPQNMDNVEVIPNSYLTPTQHADPNTPEDAPVEEISPEQAQENYDFSQSMDRQPEQPSYAGSNDSSDFSDVTDFANTNADSGPLTYVVIIDGIESSYLLKQLKEAMTDSRFGWDVVEVLSTMAGGRLLLNGLSPAKASVLINRIKYLPFKISWRQDVLSSS